MKLLEYFLDMMSRKALRRAAAQSSPNFSGSSSARKASSFPPAEIAAAMRLQGPTRVQNHDFLHVFSDTKKPAVSGPLAIGNFVNIVFFGWHFGPEILLVAEIQSFGQLSVDFRSKKFFNFLQIRSCKTELNRKSSETVKFSRKPESVRSEYILGSDTGLF